MNLEMIEDLITELEQSEMSLSNIRNLSALYTVRNQLLERSETADKVTLELSDILPSYRRYIDSKRSYQMKETTNNEAILSNLKQVCTEIKEFLQTLYSSTDMQEERTMIQKMLKEIL